MHNSKILIFIPTFNCEKQIVRVINSLMTLDNLNINFGVVCIDNGSNDLTFEIAKKELYKLKISSKYILKNNSNYGLGGSHKVAISFAKLNFYTHLLVLHGDDQCSIHDIIPHILNNNFLKFDCLLASRFMKGSIVKNYSFLRKYINLIFNYLFSIVSCRYLRDLGSGLNLYDLKIFNDDWYIGFEDNFVFNYYLLLGSCLKKHSFIYFPQEIKSADEISNVNLFNHGFKMIKILYFFTCQKNKFLTKDFRDIKITEYNYLLIDINSN